MINDKLVPKAQVHGFQQKSRIQSDYPTASKKCLRITLPIISSGNWLLNSTDIKVAFLQGKKIDRNVFIVPHTEVSTKNKLWKLESMYAVSMMKPVCLILLLVFLHGITRVMNFVEKLCEKFQAGKRSVQVFKYVGLNTVQHNENITLDQIDYISSIQSIQVSRSPFINA